MVKIRQSVPTFSAGSIPELMLFSDPFGQPAIFANNHQLTTTNCFPGARPEGVDKIGQNQTKPDKTGHETC